MGVFFVYMIKVSVCLVLFYLFYKVLLSNDTFHKINRAALVGIIAGSFLLPVLAIERESAISIGAYLNAGTFSTIVSNANENIAQQANKDSGFGIAYLIIYIYFAGILFFLLKGIYASVRLFFLMKSSRKEKIGKYMQLIVHNKQIAPFSCLFFIVISEKDLTENGREILCHEQAHILRFHAADLLISELCLLLQWFNPAAWLIRQEIKTVHEYQADNAVIDSGIDAKEYQLLLIKKAVGTIRFNMMTNSFNHSKLKKRITMMLKEKSSSWARLKYAFVLPVAAVALTVFAQPEIRQELDEISDVKVSKKTMVIKLDGNDIAEIYQDGVRLDPETYTTVTTTTHTFSEGSSNVAIYRNGEKMELNKVAPSVSYAYSVGDNGISNLDNIKVVLIDGELKPIEELTKLKPESIKTVELNIGDYSGEYGDDAKEGILKVIIK